MHESSASPWRTLPCGAPPHYLHLLHPFSLAMPAQLQVHFSSWHQVEDVDLQAELCESLFGEDIILLRICAKVTGTLYHAHPSLDPSCACWPVVREWCQTATCAPYWHAPACVWHAPACVCRCLAGQSAHLRKCALCPATRSSLCIATACPSAACKGTGGQNSTHAPKGLKM
jgi:hypothetical protein